jgi:hypothetical protein
VLPRCAMDVLNECTQQATVTALDWVPTGELVPLLTCARLGAENLLTTYSWREPLKTLSSCVWLMLADLIFYITFIATAILWKLLLVRRFQSGTWDLWDVRSCEWIRHFGGNILALIADREHTLIKALHGSRSGEWSSTVSPACVWASGCLWTETSCSWVRACTHALVYASRGLKLVAVLPSNRALSCFAQMRTSSCWGTARAWAPGRS